MTRPSRNIPDKNEPISRPQTAQHVYNENNIQGNVIPYQNLIGRLYAGFKSCDDYRHTLSFTGGEVSDAGVVYLSVILVCTKTVRVGQVRNLLL